MGPRALVIGNSDGIGLAVTRQLLAAGFAVDGVSKSASPVAEPQYRHRICDVRAGDYGYVVSALQAEQAYAACIYSAGIGLDFDPLDLTGERAVFEVNLIGLVRTCEVVLPEMVRAGRGHLVALSSIADALVSKDVPSYCASKAGMSSWLAGLQRAMRRHGVQVTNVRFGFVDTKMGQGRTRPLLMSVEAAATVVVEALRRPRPRISRPRLVAFAVGALGPFLRRSLDR